MAWYNRPEGFISKTFDVYAPPVEVANGIRFSAHIGTLTITEAPVEDDCLGYEFFPDENQWMPCATHGIECPNEKE